MANKEKSNLMEGAELAPDLRMKCDLCITEFKTKALLLGLNFPDSANEFQMSMLFLAHLMAILRDSILKGREIDAPIISDIVDLAMIADAYKNEQR